MFSSPWPEMDVVWYHAGSDLFTGDRTFYEHLFTQERSNTGPLPNQCSCSAATKLTCPKKKNEILEDRAPGHSNNSHVSVQHICDSCKDVNTGNFGQVICIDTKTKTWRYCNVCVKDGTFNFSMFLRLKLNTAFCWTSRTKCYMQTISLTWLVRELELSSIVEF